MVQGITEVASPSGVHRFLMAVIGPESGFKIVGKIGTYIGAQAVTLGIGVDHNSLLIHYIARYVIGGFAISSGQGKLIILAKGISEHFVLPVGTTIVIVLVYFIVGKNRTVAQRRVVFVGGFGVIAGT